MQNIKETYINLKGQQVDPSNVAHLSDGIYFKLKGGERTKMFLKGGQWMAEDGTETENEKIYTDHDDVYDYKVVDGQWVTRRKGDDGDWMNFSNLPDKKKQEALTKLNDAYPDAMKVVEESQDDNNTNNSSDDQVKQEDKDAIIDDSQGQPQGLQLNKENLKFVSPPEGNLLSGMGDTNILDLLKAIDTTVKDFKPENYYDPGTKEDYMKWSHTNTTDEDLYIDQEALAKGKKTGDVLKDAEQMREIEMQKFLDDRHERQPDKYAKVKDYDEDLFKATGHLDYRKGLFNKKLRNDDLLEGDMLEQKYRDASHIGWSTDEMGDYDRGFDYLTADESGDFYNQQSFDGWQNPNSGADDSREYERSIKHDDDYNFATEENYNTYLANNILPNMNLTDDDPYAYTKIPSMGPIQPKEIQQIPLNLPEPELQLPTYNIDDSHADKVQKLRDAGYTEQEINKQLNLPPLRRGGDIVYAQDGVDFGMQYNPAIRCGPGGSCQQAGTPIYITPRAGASYNTGSGNINTNYGLGVRYNDGLTDIDLGYKRKNSFDFANDEGNISPIHAGINTVGLDVGLGRQFSAGPHDWRPDKQAYRVGLNTEYDLTNKGLSNVGLYGQYGNIGGNIGYNPQTGGVNAGLNLFFRDGAELPQAGWGDSFLDWTQTGLSAVGMVPGIGNIADAVNTGISGGRAAYAAYQGDDEAKKKYLGDMALNATAMIPGVGQMATAGKAAKGFTNVAKAIGDDAVKMSAKALTGPTAMATKYANKAQDVANITKGGMDTVKGAGQAVNLTKKGATVVDATTSGIDAVAGTDLDTNLVSTTKKTIGEGIQTASDTLTGNNQQPALADSTTPVIDGTSGATKLETPPVMGPQTEAVATTQPTPLIEEEASISDDVLASTDTTTTPFMLQEESVVSGPVNEESAPMATVEEAPAGEEPVAEEPIEEDPQSLAAWGLETQAMGPIKSLDGFYKEKDRKEMLPEAQFGTQLDYLNTGFNPYKNTPGAMNFGTEGFQPTPISMNMFDGQSQAPEKSEPYFSGSDRMYASSQAVNRSMDSWNSFTADMNKRMENPSLQMNQVDTSPLQTPQLDQGLMDQMQRTSDMIEHKQAREDGRVTSDGTVIKSAEQMQESVDETSAKLQETVDNIPEYTGTKQNLDDYNEAIDKGFEGPNAREDYLKHKQNEEKEDIARDIRKDKLNKDNKGNNPSLGDKLWNAKNRLLDSKAGQTFGKIGAGAVRIAKPLNRILEQREERERKKEMSNAYLADNMFATTDADLSGSRGDYDANTGIFRAEDRITTRQGKYGTELSQYTSLPKANQGLSTGMEYFKNNYPGYDELTPEQQQQLMAEYFKNANYDIPGITHPVNTVEGYSDQYKKAMDWRADRPNTYISNISASQFPNYYRDQPEGVGRIVINDDLRNRIEADMRSGNVSKEVAEQYHTMLSGLKSPLAAFPNVQPHMFLDYNLEDMRRNSYTHDFPGAGIHEAYKGNVSPEGIERLIELSKQQNQPRTKWPELEEPGPIFSKKDLRVPDDSWIGEYDDRLIEIPENIEEEEDPFALQGTVDVGPLQFTGIHEDAITLPHKTIASIDNPYYEEPVLNVQNFVQPTENEIIEASIDEPVLDKWELKRLKRQQMFADQIDPQAGSNESTIQVSNTPTNKEVIVNEEEESGYVPQSQRRKEYTPQSIKYGGSFYNNGGEAEIDINMYKELIAAGADLEII